MRRGRLRVVRALLHAKARRLGWSAGRVTWRRSTATCDGERRTSGAGPPRPGTQAHELGEAVEDQTAVPTFGPRVARR